jgi:cephalosporin-C deacetylase-like acetyl esterase
LKVSSMGTDPGLKTAVRLWGLDKDGRYQGMLMGFFERQATRLAANLARPGTRHEWLQQAAEIRANLLHSLGLCRMPARTPLSAQVVGQIERSPHRIEKVIYEPRTGFPVSAHLYLPAELDHQAPAVLYAPGHAMKNGKLEPYVQACCANLARLGFVVLVYDPIGQGERLGDWLDHGHLELLLAGLTQEGLMVWESMRAIDYLASRHEVDPQRIGMTGASGGGLNTFYTAAVDDRIQVSVPVCYVTTFRQMVTAERDRSWGGGTDLCNQVPGVMAYSEMSDICGLFAPKPQCIIAGTRDATFPIEGTRQVYRDLRHIYEINDAAESVSFAEIDAEHGYDRSMREVAYGWFVRWLQGHGDGQPIPEAQIDPLPVPYPRDLPTIRYPNRGDQLDLHPTETWAEKPLGFCFQDGTSPKPGPAITALVKETVASFAREVNPPGTVEEWLSEKDDLLRHLLELLGPFPDHALGRSRLMHQISYKGLFAERVVFESEPGIAVPSWFLLPTNGSAPVPVILYVDEWGKEAGMENGVIPALLALEFAVLAVDVRGVGETAVSDFEAATNALMTDRPLFGQRVWDLLQALNWLQRHGVEGTNIDADRIGCVGRGTAGLLALVASALDQRLAATVMWEAPPSFTTLIVERPSFPASAFLFGALEHFDLPLLMAALAPRPLLLAEPVDGERQPMSSECLAPALTWPTKVYSLLQADAERFQGFVHAETRSLPVDHIAQWLEKHLWKAARLDWRCGDEVH